MSKKVKETMDRYIERTVVLSTAHITKQTSELLDSDAISELVVYPKGEYGYFVHVPTESIESIPNCPEDLAACIDMAKECNCEWLMLDRDADVVESLPKYDW